MAGWSFREAQGRTRYGIGSAEARNALTVDDLIAHCRRSLANYKIPRRVEFSETELPKSGSGKALKRVLRECFWAHQERVVG